MDFITKYSESVQKGTKEVNNKPSMTEPDNAMSIPEIIAKFTRGYGIPVQQHPWQSGSAAEPDGTNPNDSEDFFGPEVPVAAPAEPAKPVVTSKKVISGGPGLSATVVEESPAPAGA